MPCLEHTPWAQTGVIALLLSLAASFSPAQTAEAPADAPTPTAKTTAEPTAGEDDEDAAFDVASAPWTGDLDGMVERGFLRIGTVYNPIFLTYDGPNQSGSVVDGAEELRKFLVERLGKEARLITVAILPFARDELLPALVEGRIDLAAANLTVTPERREIVDFTDAFRKGVREVVVTGPKLGQIDGFDALVEPGLHLRASSSYAENLAALNAARKGAGEPAIPLIAMDEALEDHDLLEMVSAGALPAVVVDNHKADLWAQVFEGLVIHDNLILGDEGEIALALRKDSPKLMAVMNDFAETAKQGTLLGNILIKRYYGDTDRVLDALQPESAERFRKTLEIIGRHAATYAFDELLIAAQGFQESRLDQSKKSDAGAIGVMQVLPTTAKDPNVGIPDIHHIDKNVEAGVKYLRFLSDRYFDDPAIAPEDRVFLSLAAYNAGPANIRKSRARAEKMGLDPNRWFNHVEIATARTVSSEPVIYVRNILKYYAQYRLNIEDDDG